MNGALAVTCGGALEVLDIVEATFGARHIGRFSAHQGIDR